LTVTGFNPNNLLPVLPIQDLGSRIPNPYIDSIMKKFLHVFKNKIIFNFMIFVATKNGKTNKIYPLIFVVVLLDPRWIKFRSGINIPDPQHCLRHSKEK
jgi:hypothetical protein